MNRDTSYQSLNEQYLLNKWTFRDVRQFVDMMASGHVRENGILEVDWYPWFKR